jgi:hypothetical protein
MERRFDRICECRERATERQVQEAEEQVVPLEASIIETIMGIIIEGMGNLRKIMYEI